MRIIFSAAVFLFLLSAGNVHAYYSTQQIALEAPRGSALFLVDFTFGHKDHEVSIPVRAHHGAGTIPDSITYSVADEAGIVQPGSTVGMVLSFAQFRDGMYRVPKGSAATFTLLVSYTPPATAPEHQYRLLVNGLPFLFDARDQLKLNPSELVYYATPAVTLD